MSESNPESAESIDSQDIAEIQRDGSLTAADRMDLIANQAVPDGDEEELDLGPESD
ncbi:hypothetical protein [Arthrobacter rhizosphaerae]|uniref:hypothetical protein n=1 Tax=Arthrobacter rhizosphaerae TaxID=2855490 RepID=UPI001FF6744C|nr:hypothetical protein [Arthrobacter rhizosphaerae]